MNSKCPTSGGGRRLCGERRGWRGGAETGYLSGAGTAGGDRADRPGDDDPRAVRADRRRDGVRGETTGALGAALGRLCAVVTNTTDFSPPWDGLRVQLRSDVRTDQRGDPEERGPTGRAPPEPGRDRRGNELRYPRGPRASLCSSGGRLRGLFATKGGNVGSKTQVQVTSSRGR